MNEDTFREKDPLIVFLGGQFKMDFLGGYGSSLLNQCMLINTNGPAIDKW